jgi:hypothetical protein
VSNKSTELDNIILPLNTVTDAYQKETSVINAENITQEITTMYSEAEALQKNLIDFTQTLSLDLIKKHEDEEKEQSYRPPWNSGRWFHQGCHPRREGDVDAC